MTNGSFMDIAAEELRWPKQGDRLLRPSENWWDGGEFAESEEARHAFIWDGSMQAGDTLLAACQEDPMKRRTLIYPALFNYRQGIELAMKWVISRYGRYSTVNVEDCAHHNLWKLWRVCRQIILEVGSDDGNGTLNVVEIIIKEFHDLDPTGQAFRYSTSPDGELLPLPKDPIDLENIRDVMKAVSHFFDGVDGQLDHNSSAVDWDWGDWCGE